MNRVNLRIAIPLIFFLFVASCFACKAANKNFFSREYAHCSNGVMLRSVDKVSTLLLSSMSKPINENNDFGGITYLPFDEEELSRIGGTYVIGLIIIRSGDLGSTPFSALVLSKSSDILTPTGVQENQRAVIDVRFKYVSKTCSDHVSISVNSKGVVFLDGTPIATVH